MPGLVQVLTNSQLDEIERKAMLERQSAPLVSGLVSYLKTCWDAARDAKMPINTEMIEALRQRDGVYEPTKLNDIAATGGSSIFMQLTETKCRAAEAWIRDILLNDGAPPWGLHPTPLPDLPPQLEEQITLQITQQVLQQIMAAGVAPTPEQLAMLKEQLIEKYKQQALDEATKRTDAMEQRIHDQFAEGGFLKAFDEFVTDLTTYHAGIIKAPILRRRRQLDWQRDELGQIGPKAVEKIIPCYERVDPFRLYPEPGISEVEDGYIFEHHRLSRTDLAMLKGLPGYDDRAISEILDTATTGSLSGWLETTEFTRSDLEKRYSAWMRPTLMIDALEFWGHVSGRMLMEWGGIEDQVFDPDAEYSINAWMIDRWLIKVVINPDPLARKPYFKTSFFKIPGAFWGRGIPEVMKDTQQMVNAAARALSNNMGMASGPQVMVNLDRLPPGDTVSTLTPWKVWQVLSDPVGNSANKAIEFEHPESHAQELMGIIQSFSKLADDHTGIPAYVYGDTDVSGAGRTASGLSMLMGSAGKGLRQVVMYIDNDILRPIVERQYHFNMRYDEDASIKGDCEVVPKGAINLAVKEQLNMRRIEFLNATANPVDMQIVGLEGRAAILREVAKELNMPADEIVPDIDELRQRQMMMAMAPPPEESGPPGKKPEVNKNPPGDTQQTLADGGKVGEEVEFVRDASGSILGAKFKPMGQ